MIDDLHQGFPECFGGYFKLDRIGMKTVALPDYYCKKRCGSLQIGKSCNGDGTVPLLLFFQIRQLDDLFELQSVDVVTFCDLDLQPDSRS